MQRVRDRTVPKLTEPSGAPMLCQHYVALPGVCLDCKSHRVAVQCTSRAVYPDHKCCQHTVWLAGTWKERAAADQVGDGRPYNETARHIAWTRHALDNAKKP
jgi:hypothetical protein